MSDTPNDLVLPATPVPPAEPLQEEGKKSPDAESSPEEIKVAPSPEEEREREWDEFVAANYDEKIGKYIRSENKEASLVDGKVESPGAYRHWLKETLFLEEGMEATVKDAIELLKDEESVEERKKQFEEIAYAVRCAYAAEGNNTQYWETFVVQGSTPAICRIFFAMKVLNELELNESTLQMLSLNQRARKAGISANDYAQSFGGIYQYNLRSDIQAEVGGLLREQIPLLDYVEAKVAQDSAMPHEDRVRVAGWSTILAKYNLQMDQVPGMIRPKGEKGDFSEYQEMYDRQNDKVRVLLGHVADKAQEYVQNLERRMQEIEDQAAELEKSAEFFEGAERERQGTVDYWNNYILERNDLATYTPREVDLLKKEAVPKKGLFGLGKELPLDAKQQEAARKLRILEDVEKKGAELALEEAKKNLEIVQGDKRQVTDQLLALGREKEEIAAALRDSL